MITKQNKTLSVAKSEGVSRIESWIKEEGMHADKYKYTSWNIQIYGDEGFTIVPYTAY